MKNVQRLNYKNNMTNMKTLLKIGICLLLAAGFAACDKDETPVIGRLEVEYKGAKANLVSIDTEAGNEINPRSKFSIDLNPGNYAIFSGGFNNSHSKYFQIQAGRTTHVTYDDSGDPAIKYE